jgi:predicted DNA-binding transcriptional regulator AlpA
LPPDQLLSIEQAQSIIPLSKSWFANSRWKKTGPPYVKIGTRVLYRRAELLAWAERHAVSTGEASALDLQSVA